MVTPRKLNVHFCYPSYGGNGGIACEHPSIRKWAVQTTIAAKADPRIGKITEATENDTPITMVRNRFVEQARLLEADILVMVDSDQEPDMYADKPKFWDTTFDFIFNHYDRGPCVVGAPYVGPPPKGGGGWGECCYVFRWASLNSGPNKELNLQMYGRDEAATLTGICPVAALPTGLIAYDMRCFDLIEHPYFEYEWKDEKQCQKASTEDVENTRNISLAGCRDLGYNPVYCNWDCWAGHWKPLCAGKPVVYGPEDVNKKYLKAVRAKNHQVIEMGGAIPAESELGKRILGKDPTVACAVKTPDGNGRSV